MMVGCWRMESGEWNMKGGGGGWHTDGGGWWEGWRVEGRLVNMNVKGGSQGEVDGWRVEYQCRRLDFGGWNMQG